MKAILTFLLLIQSSITPYAPANEALIDSAQRNDLPGVLRALESGADINAKTFARRNNVIESVIYNNPTGKDRNLKYLRVSDDATAPPTGLMPGVDPADASRQGTPVVRFPRSQRGGFLTDGQGAVVEWDVTTGRNILWKTLIPGMANASPIIWSDRVFVITAIS